MVFLLVRCLDLYCVSCGFAAFPGSFCLRGLLGVTFGVTCDRLVWGGCDFEIGVVR